MVAIWVADLHSSSSGPRPACTSQPTLHASSPSADLVPAGGAVSLPLWLCTRLPGVRSAARLRPRPQLTLVTSVFEYVSTCWSTHPVCYRRRPCLPGSCTASVWNSVPESFGRRHYCQFFAAGFLLGLLRLALLTKHGVLCDSFSAVACPCSVIGLHAIL